MIPFLGQYRIIRELGRGGQGSVYLAEDTKLGRRVALKVLNGVPQLSPRSVERFRREAEITAQIDHPGICTTYDFGNDEGTSWIAMRYIEGETLAAKIAAARGPAASGPTEKHWSFAEEAAAASSSPSPTASSSPSPTASPSSQSTSRSREEIAWVVRVIEQAARALHVAHEQGVIHRDIKPANIMVAPDDTPVILDFGLANVVEGTGPALTITGELMGTPHYIAPEQLTRTSIALDRRADVYSLGITLYEALTLSRPFDSPTRERLYQAILAKDPPDPHRINPAISRDLSAVVATAIEKDRDRRYQTALDFATDLRRVLDRVPVLARRTGPLARGLRWVQRNPVVAASAAAVFLALSAGLVTTLVLLGTTKEALQGFERLSDIKRLRDLSTEADAFWPALPSKAAAMRAWLRRAENLVTQIPVHEIDLANHDAAVAARGGNDVRAEDAWKHDYLSELLRDLRKFADPDPFRGLLADVRQRLVIAETIQKDSIDDFGERWKTAASDIAASDRYSKLVLRPQLGLVPLGKNPGTGLCEFAVLHSGGIPETDGRAAVYEFDESSAIVLVLLPGGTFRMGSPPEEKDRKRDEDLRAMTLEPFFIGKHEVSQVQWKRIVGADPTSWTSADTPLHPANAINWFECTDAARRLGLALPTESQWEYACRAGSTSAFTWGDDETCLKGRANVADQSVTDLGRGQRLVVERAPWNDGFPVTAPVNALAANAFGLYGLHGNVGEWCQDWAPLPANAPSPTAQEKIWRDGTWISPPLVARSAARHQQPPDQRTAFRGVRFARALDRAAP